MNPSKKFSPEYIARVEKLLGNETKEFFSSLSRPPFLSVRINPFKPTTAFDSCESVPWCSEGKYLNSRPSFTLDPLFHAGTYYVQEPSSMFLSEIFKQLFPPSNKSSLKVLDLCAAPGGKSTLILSEISPESLVVANETIHSRVAPLRENLIKWGNPNVFLTGNDSKQFSAIRNYFDIILIDAPCSGEGLFRKDEKAINEWSENNVKLCSARQKRILSDVTGSLKENGILIFSTCTFSEEENEENVRFIASDGHFESVRIDLKKEWNIKESVDSSGNPPCYSYRFYPHRVRGEGFFVSVLKKAGAMENYVTKRNAARGKSYGIPKEWIRIIEPWLKKPEMFEFVALGDKVYAVLKSHWPDYLFLSSKLNIRSSGVCLGKIVNDGLIPSHQLALSSVISEQIVSVDLDKEDALNFLRRQNISSLDINFKGWALVKFSGRNLGWIKILDNRINNYFPKELRILKS